MLDLMKSTLKSDNIYITTSSSSNTTSTTGKDSYKNQKLTTFSPVKTKPPEMLINNTHINSVDKKTNEIINISNRIAIQYLEKGNILRRYIKELNKSINQSFFYRSETKSFHLNTVIKNSMYSVYNCTFLIKNISKVCEANNNSVPEICIFIYIFI